MSARFEVAIPAPLWLTSNRQPSNRAHRSRIVAGLHEATWQALRLAPPIGPLDGPVHVTWTVRYGKGTGRADASNAQPTTKALLDAVVQAGVLPDDDSRTVVAETFRRGPNTTERGDRRIDVELAPAARPTPTEPDARERAAGDIDREADR